MIHVDGHGVEGYESLSFPCDRDLSYLEILPYFREINRSCNNNLIVTSGACGFVYILKYGITIKDICPVFYILAPEQDVPEITMERGFIAFFKTFIESGLDIEVAHKNFRKHVKVSDYSSLFAQKLIEDTIIGTVLSKEESFMDSLVDTSDIHIINLKLKGYKNIFNRFLMVDNNSENQRRFQFDENKCISMFI